ncbi:MAG: MFS transporter, partial [Planctomycetota bacterium]
MGYIRDMHAPADDSPPQRPLTRTADWPGQPQIESRERGNLLLLALHQIVLRTGWLFKTESVIIPAFLDTVTGGVGWIRGCLPVLNRLGQCVTPVFCADYLRAMRHKKRALAAFAVLMSLPFGALAAVWFATAGEERSWMPGFFLTLYLAFFVFYGLYLVSFGTVQGKLIRPTKRGRLILMSTFWGTLPAIVFAYWLMQDWLASGKEEFGCIFAFTAVCFFLSGLIVLAVHEPGDTPTQRHAKQRGSVAETVHELRHNANLRRLVLVGIIFSGGPMIVPHYQALARQRLDPAGFELMIWVVTQSIAVGVFSVFVGLMADSRGNRLTLRMSILISALAPALAVLISHLPGGV